MLRQAIQAAKFAFPEQTVRELRSLPLSKSYDVLLDISSRPYAIDEASLQVTTGILKNLAESPKVEFDSRLTGIFNTIYSHGKFPSYIEAYKEVLDKKKINLGPLEVSSAIVHDDPQKAADLFWQYLEKSISHRQQLSFIFGAWIGYR
ncbi:unnamed protein product [Ambrosiozyma monospora]|uniref:Unnamed protein product n=1 Tax=Ambrosiozyma monospora TaxID=43982 RepID=A0A9W6Z1G8_AMBMO|nr:unnamed protein product [Ambrosiozyma monospora]